MKKTRKFVPYLLAIARWLLSLLSLGLVGFFAESAATNGVEVGHPFFTLISVMMFGLIGFAGNYIFKPITIRLGGNPDRFFWQCIWASIFQTMTTFTGIFLAGLIFVGIFFERLPEFIQAYPNEPPKEAHLIWVLFIGFTLGVYLLEAWTKIPPLPPEPKRSALPKPKADPHGAQSFKNEVDDLLDKIKKNNQ